ncbi:Golgi CORVET complex core vacuolar protein 8-domain-containing protein [Gloeopeniophorella convolvens]|nr:Golgi CORVET complex core vacuolar protein 8-domain-containing protein [Gloeopeniophorella convolvens]
MSVTDHSRRPSLGFSDFGSDDEEHVDTHGGDYSARMGELFDDEDEPPVHGTHAKLDDEDDDEGEAFVYDGADAAVSHASYRQQMRDVLGDEDEDDEDVVEEREVEHSLLHGHPPIGIVVEDEAPKTVGAVTALALSHDHTFVAAGHATGHIQLFDLSKPQVSARSVPPTTLAAVASGRKEGHIQGSRIVNIGFVAGRHTAVVTADQTGLAFYHSLGKALFFEASDVLRILGKYPDEEIHVPGQLPFHRRRARRANTILAMAPLPLGTVPHPTDAYNVTALLTAVKIVIVGLKPSPKTWYRKHRDEDDEQMGKAKFRGALAWFPSVVPGAPPGSMKLEPAKKVNGKGIVKPPPTTPMLLYSWGPTLRLLLVSELKTSEKVTNQRTGKTTTIEVGRLVLEEKARWRAQDNVCALQWLNANQILAVTASGLEVYDVHTHALVEHVHFDPTSLISPTISHTINGAFSYSDAMGDIAHSVRTYKGKIFLLGRYEVQVGTLLTWADRILSFVEDGDFLNAIDLTRSYYLGTAPGNRNGLPDDPQELKKVVGEKMRELMVASTRYAFSEERMTDATHRTPDGRGVDRTSLFENLVATCARACIALGDFEFLFEDLFQAYDDAGIAQIYLEQLETFILEHDVHTVDPRIAQRLIAMHAAHGRADRAERVIWHIDPACLDIDQAVQLCQAHRLYDALIYVYTRAMRDYVAPVVEMLGLIRRVMQLRRAGTTDEETLEPVIVNAYKVYPYLADVLSGLTYPSEEPLDEDEATEAKRDLYTFLFHGRSSTWPRGDGGKLVLTAEEDGGLEPTYPYCRLLLRFDAEAFLHALDLAFEDAYLNDEDAGGASRLVIVKILLEILASSSASTAPPSAALPPGAATFVHIFVARNVPKYPQFIQMPPSVLHGLLVGLAADADGSTREDRQLAAEYLLSAYTPHEADALLPLFEAAGFWRILRAWHRQEAQWAPLLRAHLRDPAVRAPELFASAHEILATASAAAGGALPGALAETLAGALPEFLAASAVETARFVDAHAPHLHEPALVALGDDAPARFAYLRCLLGPPSHEEEPAHAGAGPSPRVPPALRAAYVALLCDLEPGGVIPALAHLPPDYLDWDATLDTCEARGARDAVVPRAALAKADAFNARLATTLGGLLARGAEGSGDGEGEEEARRCVESLEAVGRAGVAVCVERSNAHDEPPDAPVEDLWFALLHAQIGAVQAVSACCPPPPSADTSADAPPPPALSALRALVQQTFAALVSASAARGRARVSFARLFARLVGSAARSPRGGTPYTEFRAVLRGMLEAYRGEGDALALARRLLARDVFAVSEAAARARGRGWAPRAGACGACRRALVPVRDAVGEGGGGGEGVVVLRSGAVFHAGCVPAEVVAAAAAVGQPV